MRITNVLGSNIGAQASAGKNVLFHMLLMAMVICGMAGATANAAYPILKLDCGPSAADAQTEEGFTGITVGDSGIVVDGITIEIGTTEAGEGIQQRNRNTTGIPYELLYRDFWFTVNGGLTITLSGLNPNQTYEITMFSWDSQSAEDHLTDWLANGVFCLTTDFSGGDVVTAEDSYAYSGNATANDSGTIFLEATPNPSTSYPGPPGQYFCFLNALIVSSITPITKAQNPEPADGALHPDVEVTLGWTPGAYAVSNNVYLGDNFDDVNNATPEDANVFLGSTQENSFSIMIDVPPYPEGLVRGTTYYWRVDGINESNQDSPWKGNVWSFTVQPKTAFNPSPVDTSLFADPNLTLVWDPGSHSIEHRVFLGDSLEDVQAGTGGTDKGVTTEPNYYTGGLEPDTTYYWRVDEFDGMNTSQGNVWSFTTAGPDNGTIIVEVWENISGDSTLVNLLDNPRYPENPTRSEALTEFGTVNGFGDGYGAQISGWLYCPVTGEYTFYFSSAGQGELWLSTDDDPANVLLIGSENTWGAYNSFSYKSDPISLVAGERYYIMARWKDYVNWDHCQVAWRGPGIRGMEIIQGSFLSPFAPIEAYGPVPTDSSVDVRVDPVLMWKAGKYAASHTVYLGTDPNAIGQVGTAQLGDESYAPASQLLFNQTYYWRIDEVNSPDPCSPWIGETWSFTTGNYIVVEDFEDYNDYTPDEVWNTWLDGYGNPLNGSTAGYGDPDFVAGEHYLEDANVHGGQWSMPLFYDNSTAPISEVTRSFSSSERNFTRDDVVTLSMFFCGDPNNVAEPMFVALDDAVITHENPDVALITEWTQWEIPLQAFADQGANLNSVGSMTIGFGNKANPTADAAAGHVFFDDIRLYRAAP